MKLPDPRIVEFINKHHVLTLATCYEEEPWCANCFYVYMADDNCLVFTSDNDTRHIRYASHNIYVAGSIVLETHIVGKIQGIQFQGIISQPDSEYYEKVRKAYVKRFPIAMLMDTTLWVVDLTYIKFTDNRMGFGKKLIWERGTLIDPLIKNAEQ